MMRQYRMLKDLRQTAAGVFAFFGNLAVARGAGERGVCDGGDYPTSAVCFPGLPEAAEGLPVPIDSADQCALLDTALLSLMSKIIPAGALYLADSIPTWWRLILGYLGSEPARPAAVIECLRAMTATVEHCLPPPPELAHSVLAHVVGLAWKVHAYKRTPTFGDLQAELARAITALLDHGPKVPLRLLTVAILPALELCLQPDVAPGLQAVVCRLVAASYMDLDPDVAATSEVPPSELLRSWLLISDVLVGALGTAEFQGHLVEPIQAIAKFELRFQTATATAATAETFGPAQVEKRRRVSPTGAGGAAVAGTAPGGRDPGWRPHTIEALTAKVEAGLGQPLPTNESALHKYLEVQQVLLRVLCGLGQSGFDPWELGHFGASGAWASMLGLPAAWMGVLDLATARAQQFPAIYGRLVSMAELTMQLSTAATVHLEQAGLVAASRAAAMAMPSPELTRVIAVLVSLPWLLKRDCHSAGGVFAEGLTKYLNQAVDFNRLRSQWQMAENMIPDEVLCRCIAVLPEVAEPGAGQWCAVVLDHALGHSRVCVRAAAIRTIPRVIARDWRAPSQQQGAFEGFEARLTARISDREPIVTRAIATAAGELACAMATRGSSTNCQPVYTTGPSQVQLPTLLCVACSSRAAGVTPVGTRKSSHCEFVVGNPTPFMPFLELLKSSDTATRLAAARSLRQLLAHIAINAGQPPGGFPFKQCIAAIGDSSAEIRAVMVESIPHFFLFGIDMGHVIKFIWNVVRECDQEIRETLLRVMGQIGRMAEGDHLKNSLIFLLSGLRNKSPLLRATAFEELRTMTTFRGTQVDKLLGDFPKDVGIMLVDALATIPVPSELLSQLLEGDHRDLYRSTLKYTLPHLILKQNDESEKSLRELAVVIGLDFKSLLTDFTYVVWIFTGLLLSDGGRTNHEINQKISFWNKLVAAGQATATLNLIKKSMQGLIKQLVWNLGDDVHFVVSSQAAECAPAVGGSSLEHFLPPVIKHPEGPFRMLQSLYDDRDCELTDFLARWVVGIVHSLNEAIFGKSTGKGTREFRSSKDKRRALQSLLGFVGVIGAQNLGSIHVNVIGILGQCSHAKYAELHDIVCKVWVNFVQVLDLATLKKILAEVAVALLPLLESKPNDVAAIFRYLIVQPSHRAALREDFNHLYFLPSYPCLREVNAVLASEQAANGSDQSSLDGILAEHVLEGLTNETIQVHQQALIRLKGLLEDNRSKITSLILSRDTFDIPERIRRILQDVLRCACHDDSKTRHLAGECLGEIGAIDPGRVGDLMLNAEKDDDRYTANKSITDLEVSVMLISKLVKAFKAATKTDTQDRVACAIQDCLSAYGCKASFPLDGIFPNRALPSQSEQLWSKLAQSERDIIHPFLSTLYRAAPRDKIVEVVKPLFTNMSLEKKKRDKHGVFKEWFTSWMASLVTYMKNAIATRLVSTSVDSSVETATAIFAAVLGPAKNSMDTTLFLMPHLVLNVISVGEPELTREVRDEIMAVLQQPTAKEAPSYHFARVMACKAVFAITDHITRWKLWAERLQQSSREARGSRRRQDPAVSDRLTAVRAFLASLSPDTLALAAFRCQDYARALLYLEAVCARDSSGGGGTDFMETKPDSPAVPRTNEDESDGNTIRLLTREQADSYLQRAYHALGDLDGMAGVAATRDDTPLEAETLDNRAAGRWTHAVSCYERALYTTSQARLGDQSGLIECQMKLGHLKTAIAYATGAIAEHTHWTPELNSKRVQAAWRLADWGSLSDYLKLPITPGFEFETSLGQIVDAARRRDRPAFQGFVDECRDGIASRLSALGLERASYERAYQHMVQLHMLHEAEHSLTPLLDNSSDALILAGNWENRLSLVQASYVHCEPVLAFRRCIMALLDEHAQATGAAELEPARAGGLKRQLVRLNQGKAWLESAALARKEGLLQTAYTYILQARQYQPPNLSTEHAKLLWDMNEQHQALSGLQASLSPVSEVGSGHKTSTSREHGEALLLVADWMVQTQRFTSEVVINRYKDIITVQPHWEEGYFALARYYEDLVDNDAYISKNENEGEDLSSTLTFHAVINYGKSLEYGSKYIFQALPRMLSIWLEHGAKVSQLGGSRSSLNIDETIKRRMTKGTVTLRKLNAEMAKFIKVLPAFQFLTALPQLMSRICHPNGEVIQMVEQIIIKLLRSHHQQTLWMMMAGVKSTDRDRAKRCAAVLKRAETELKRELDLRRIKDTFLQLAEQLLVVCNYQPNEKHQQKVDTLSMKRHFQRLLSLRLNSVVIPLTSAMTVTLPSPSTLPSDHRAFPANLPTFSRFEDSVKLLPSLQQPKKITIVGSDGKKYIFLCKPKDDLRMDCRVMEFNSLINKLLKKNPETRQRRLAIRTYAVMPLNEECGLLEWVSNTAGYRNIVNDIYRSKGRLPRSSEIKTIMNLRSGPNKHLTLAEVFRTKLLPRFPPVFAEWFVNTFPDPTMWYNARLTYVRTSAVMSMVGFIIGLGDRHGENILFDSKTGDTVHVDFNCLFNKGENFRTPEKVPFRLTHNMVHAMGPTGYDGAFRRACEVTLRVMRNEKNALISVLHTFAYDPLLEWETSTSSKSNKKGEDKDEKNEMVGANKDAVKIMKNITSRLIGKTKGVKTKGLPLSIEGQVQQLINEATAIENLAEMYIGWAAFL